MAIAEALRAWGGWLLSWLLPAAAGSGVHPEEALWIALFGLVAGAIVDAAELIARSRWVTQALLVNLFLGVMFQAGFAAPQIYHGDAAHYPRRVLAFGLLAGFFCAVAIGMRLTRLARRYKERVTLVRVTHGVRRHGRGGARPDLDALP